jgi:hypothetical protein
MTNADVASMVVPLAHLAARSMKLPGSIDVGIDHDERSSGK